MTIAEALRAAAFHVEEHKAMLDVDGQNPPSDDEKARIVAEISALGREIESLAAAAGTSPVYRREFEAIRAELHRRGSFLSPALVEAVAAAFDAERLAKGPQPRRPG